MPRMILALASAALLAAPALARPEALPRPAGEQVSIPFVNFGGVRTFHADNDETVYIQDIRRKWYRAEIIGPCIGLRWAIQIGVDTRGSSSFDRYSSLLVDGQRCALSSLTRSERPARRSSRGRSTSR